MVPDERNIPGLVLTLVSLSFVCGCDFIFDWPAQLSVSLTSDDDL
jgi:hypothetical protein